jgi:hypothetical protein
LEVLGTLKVQHIERRVATGCLLIHPALISAKNHMEDVGRTELQLPHSLSCSRMQRRSSRQHQAWSQECLGQIKLLCSEVLQFRVILLQFLLGWALSLPGNAHQWSGLALLLKNSLAVSKTS